jgi:hypothetical protein
LLIEYNLTRRRGIETLTHKPEVPLPRTDTASGPENFVQPEEQHVLKCSASTSLELLIE